MLCPCSIFQFSEFAWQQWPDGNYATPMSVYGCPDQDLNNWETGYINLTFGRHYDLKEVTQTGSTVKLERWDNLFSLGPFGEVTFQLNFCVKVAKKNGVSTHDFEKEDEWLEDVSTTTEWPRGTYAIYDTVDNCPSGNALVV